LNRSGLKSHLGDRGRGNSIIKYGRDIDVYVSGIMRREMTVDGAGDALIDAIVSSADGRLTAAEVLGRREFVMTKLYRNA
jgi:(2R)-sulfolactate sulfo-lyase subunit beta